MRIAPFLVLLALLAGCDAVDSTEPQARIPDGSFVEGVATLPDGSTFAFRSEGEAYAGKNASDHDYFFFGTRHVYPSPTPDAMEVAIAFNQPYQSSPVMGAFETRFWDPDREWVQAYFHITNVPGLDAADPGARTTLSEWLPIGTMDVARDRRGWLVGTFEMDAYRYPTPGDSTRIARVEGSFEVPISPRR